MNKSIKCALLATTLILPAFANASTFNGIPKAVRVNEGTPSTSARVGINVGPHGSPCLYADWFAYENGTTNTQSLWTKGSLESVGRRNVTIVGTGVCDSFGVEKIYYIDFK